MRRLETAAILLCSAFVFIQCVGCASFCMAKDIDLQNVRETLKQTWDAVENVSIHGEEFLCDDGGRRDDRPGLSTSEFDVIIASGGRRFQRVVEITARGERRVRTDIRQDGKKVRDLQYFDDLTQSPKNLVIQFQKDSHDNYRGSMVIATNLWAPLGRPLHSYLVDGGRLESARGEGGRETVSLIPAKPYQNIRIELDADHGWLAKKFVVGQDMEIVATRFSRDNGIWFPVEGYITHLKAAKNLARQEGFRVTGLRVNRQLSDFAFAAPPLPPGVFVADETGGRSGPQGGLAAWKRLESEHAAGPAKNGTMSGARPYEPPAGSRKTDGGWMGILLGGTSLGFLLIALLLKVRSTHRLHH
jgi:hypothetical protein